MKIISKKTVLEAGLDRIRRLFDEFPNPVVGFSGGKDSTVILYLCLQVAKEKGRLPLKVMFIDQEAEWQGTQDYVKQVMYMPEVQPYWFQMPMVITNNASSYERYSYCWDPNKKSSWIHEQDPISIKENKYGTDRFHDLFEAILKVEFPNIKSCYISGVRAEEAPKRFVALTDQATYKDITWGKKLYKPYEQYSFYPLYDWLHGDVWKYIHDNDIPYNRVYDDMYRHGVHIRGMRISNLHHETALDNLLLVQEIEPQTWEKIAQRIDGANTIKHIRLNSYTCPDTLPPMFESWEEYAFHLADNIIQDEKHKKMWKDLVEKKRKIYDTELIQPIFWRALINTILSSDWDFTKFKNWEIRQYVYGYRKFKEGKINRKTLMELKYFSAEEIQQILNKLEEDESLISKHTKSV
jgi:predicted phosphoadenosine phosphosulfate sulfurtransferase